LGFAEHLAIGTQQNPLRPKAAMGARLQTSAASSDSCRVSSEIAFEVHFGQTRIPHRGPA